MTSISSNGADGGPLKKTESYSASKSAMAAIFGKDHRYAKESPAAVPEEGVASGSGSQSGQEPPSGVKGKGTATEPYDQGNAPEQIARDAAQKNPVNGAPSGEEPVSGVKGKGTADEPYDQGNTGESTAGAQPVNTTISPSANGTAKPAATPTPPTSQPEQPSKPEQQQESRGRTLAPPSDANRFERSVSPGTLADGTHKTCSGENGKSYTPNSGFGKLKDKLRGH